MADNTNKVMASYYMKYEELRRQTTSDPEYKVKVKKILKLDKKDIPASLKHLKNELLSAFTKHLEPELTAIFDKYDEDGNGFLDPNEAKNLLIAFLKTGKDLKVKHTVDTKLKGLKDKFPELTKLIHAGTLSMHKDANINDIITEIYKEKYIPWCANFYTVFFDDILDNIDSFSTTLVDEIDINHDDLIDKEEIINGFTVAFGHLTASGNTAFIEAETKWLREEFNIKLDSMVKEKLSQIIVDVALNDSLVGADIVKIVKNEEEEVRDCQCIMM